MGVQFLEACNCCKMDEDYTNHQVNLDQQRTRLPGKEFEHQSRDAMAGTGEAGAGTGDDFKMYDPHRSNEDYPD